MQPAVIRVEDSDSRLQLSWDNRVAPKRRFLGAFLLMFWLGWTPVTLCLTVTAFFERGFDLAFLIVWLVFGWVGVLLIPYRLLTRRWRESITIDRETVTVAYEGLLAPKPKSIPIETINFVFLGDYRDATISMLGIEHRPPRKLGLHCELIGYWLSAELQEQLFQAMEAFVDSREIALRVVRLDP